MAVATAGDCGLSHNTAVIYTIGRLESTVNIRYESWKMSSRHQRRGGGEGGRAVALGSNVAEKKAGKTGGTPTG